MLQYTELAKVQALATLSLRMPEFCDILYEFFDIRK
jgi:hypothetical protein